MYAAEMETKEIKINARIAPAHAKLSVAMAAAINKQNKSRIIPIITQPYNKWYN